MADYDLTRRTRFRTGFGGVLVLQVQFMQPYGYRLPRSCSPAWRDAGVEDLQVLMGGLDALDVVKRGRRDV